MQPRGSNTSVALPVAADIEPVPDHGADTCNSPGSQMPSQLSFTFPFCYDESQETAKAYKAACTPDFYLFDKSRQLVYRGQLDDSRPGNDIPVSGRDLRTALDAVLADRPLSPNQRPSLGCNIKWKSGNAPEYFDA